MTEPLLELLPESGGIISLVGAGGKTTLMFRLAHELAKMGESVLTTTTTKIYMPSKRQSAHILISKDLEETLRRSDQLLKNSRHVTVAWEQIPATGKLRGFASSEIGRFRTRSPFDWILVEADGASQRPLKAPADHEPVIPEDSDRVLVVVGLDCVGRPLDEQWVFRSKIYSMITGLSPGSVVTEDSVATIILDDRGLLKGCPPRAGICLFLNKAEGEKRIRSGEKIGEILRERGPSIFQKIIIGSLRQDEFRFLQG